MRSTAAAPSCASTWKPAARPTCCGSRRASASPWPAGSRSPASRPPPGCWPAAAAGRSAPPGPDPRGNAGTPGRGWPPPRPRHHLLIRRHLTTGELAFHYCYLPEGQPVSLSRPVRAAGLRWPAEEDFEFGKGCFGLDQSQVRLYTAIARHTVLVMAALAICAVTAALLRRRTGTQAPAPVLPDQPPPADPGMIPLTVPETGRLLAHPPPPGASRALAGLAAPPPGPVSLVPPAHPARPRTDIFSWSANGSAASPAGADVA